MSLTERVEEAGSQAFLDQDCEAAVQKLDELRKRVGSELPSDVLARMMAANPRRAENEMRAACERVFRCDPWFVEGEAAQAALVASFVDGVLGLGPLEPLLADGTVTEIMVNASQSVYVERDGRLERCDRLFSNDVQVMALIDRIVGPLGRRIDESSPMVNARLRQGYRVHAVIPPLALDGPVITIRKFGDRVMLLEDMVSAGSFDETMSCFFDWCVRARKNIAVSGGTGSGKTTLLNALSCRIEQSERIITIEDSAELKFAEHPHVVRLETRPKNAEGIGEVTIRDLVTNSLRMRPDRIIVGECRGGEALDMLQAMNTGHDGSMTTLHANSPSDAIMRLSTMVRYVVDIPLDAIEAQIASALDCIVQIARSVDGKRFISEVVEVGFDWQKRVCEVHPLFVRKHSCDAGSWLRIPAVLEDLNRTGALDRGEAGAWMDKACLSA